MESRHERLYEQLRRDLRRTRRIRGVLPFAIFACAAQGFFFLAVRLIQGVPFEDAAPNFIIAMLLSMVLIQAFGNTTMTLDKLYQTLINLEATIAKQKLREKRNERKS